MLPNELTDRAAALLDRYRKAGLTIATAESCTGGLVAACLTAVGGSSTVFERGYVTYSDAAKREDIGVDAALIVRHGAVSEPVAMAMATGARRRTGASVAVSVTGVAGPGGGSAEKPVGLVYLGAVRGDGPGTVARHVFPGDRTSVRQQSVHAAFDLLESLL